MKTPLLTDFDYKVATIFLILNNIVPSLYKDIINDYVDNEDKFLTRVFNILYGSDDNCPTELINASKQVFKEQLNDIKTFVQSINNKSLLNENKTNNNEEENTANNTNNLIVQTTRPYSDNKYEHVNHPNHYNNYSIEVIDMMKAIWGTDNLITFCEMNAFKYRMRLGTKPNNSIEQDINKEKWYLNKAKELKEKYITNII